MSITPYSVLAINLHTKKHLIQYPQRNLNIFSFIAESRDFCCVDYPLYWKWLPFWIYYLKHYHHFSWTIINISLKINLRKNFALVLQIHRWIMLDRSLIHLSSIQYVHDRKFFLHFYYKKVIHFYYKHYLKLLLMMFLVIFLRWSTLYAIFPF